MSEEKLVKNRNNAVLIIDDAKETLRFLTEILIADGYSVSQASSGEQALLSIKSQIPDIILLDVMMPEMDGFEVCRQLKANPETSAIPVIFISALVDDQSKVKGLEIGAVDYIIKPFSKVEVLARVKIHIEAAQLRAQLEQQTNNLQIVNNQLQSEIEKRKQAEAAMEKRIVALTQPLEDSSDILFEELFHLPEIQKLQDQFSDAFGVASIITRPDGTPITQPSNFSHLCQNIIRCTEKGLKNCMHSDAIIGRHNPEGPIVQPCLSGGLWDAGASIAVGGLHVANWLIGQVRNESQDEKGLKDYAKMIGANEQEFMKAHAKVPVMSEEQFRKVSEVLFTMSGQISQMAYQNIQQARFINDRKMVELALHESEERFRTTLYSIGDGVITTDTEGRIGLMNQLAEQLTGWKQDEAFGKTLEQVFKIINEENRNEVEIPVRKVLREGVTVGLANHTLLIAKDGTERPIADSGAPIRNEKGEIVGVVLVFRDQTEERRAEQAMIESEKRFRLLYENAPLSYQSLNPQARLIDVNPTWLRTMGYSEKDEVIGRHFGEFMTAESAELIKARFPYFVTAGEIHDYVFDMVRKDGTIITVSYEGKIGYDELGQFKQTHCIFSDITEQRKAELALIESEERFRKAIYQAPFPIMIHADDDEIIAISRGWTEMSGYEKSDIPTTREWTKLAFGNEQATVKSYIDSLYGLDHWVDEGEYEIHAKCGENRIWDFSSSPLGKLTDERRLVISMAKDVTERKQFEIKLQRSEQELKKAQEITHIGSWYLNLANNEVFWSEELYKMYGFDPTLPVPPYTEHRKLFTPESWDLLSTSLANTAESGIPYELELRTVREDGSNGWLWARGETIKDARGKTVGLWGAAQDISARKQAEHALFESEEMMRNSQSVAHICSYSTNLSIIEIGKSSWVCSPEFYKIFGIDKTYPHTLEGWAGFIHPDYLEETVAYHEYVIKERIPFEHEYKIIRINDGAERWVYGTGKLEMDEKGNPIRMHGAIQDITERKQTERAILEEKNLLRTLINNLPVTVYVKDNKARKIIANTLDLATIGILDETAVIGKTDLELFDNEIGRRGYEDDLNVIRTAKPVLNREEYFFGDKGEKHWLLTSKMPLFDENGKPNGLVGIGREITEQKKSELQIQKLTESIEQSPSSIVITDTYGNIEYVNPKFSEITGYTKEEALGQNPRILKSGENPQELYKQLWDIISAGGIWRGEINNRKKNGELYWEWATMTSIKNELGVITNYIAIKEDISLRKQMEVDLIVAKDKAEESDRLKSAFLANMSHEIRTPLNSIIGFSELLSDSDFEVDQKVEFVGHIIRNGNNLLNIINDIVDISKIEAGEITIRKSKVQVKNLMKEIHSLRTLDVEEKFLQFRITCLLSKKDEDIFVFADKERLQQIFNNLISNALKFTTNGYIEVGCEPSGDMIQFYVKDTGIGIPKAFLDLIFDRFRQVETSLTRKFGGNGLGLAISKNLVELMGGTIWAESEVGKGSTFYFTLPKV